MKSLVFTKMHGLGNDFMVVDATHQSLDITQLSIARLANRHLGIGFDQLLIIEPSQHATAFCRIFNADGSEAEQCGNGLRCVARYLHENNSTSLTEFSIATKAGIFPVTISDYDHITVILSSPEITQPLVTLDLPSQSLPISIITTGNPHAIVKVQSLEELPVEQWSHEIATHTYFPQGVNVGFLEILNRGHAKLRTVERGAGETHACGSNACAAVAAGIINNWLDHIVKLEFRLGCLTIAWDGVGKPIYMTGPASKVFTGSIAI